MKKFKPKVKTVYTGSRGFRLTKKCATCGHYPMGGYIPDEYSQCDFCFMSQFDFRTCYDALDHLCMTELLNKDDVLRVLRVLMDGVVVDFKNGRKPKKKVAKK